MLPSYSNAETVQPEYRYYYIGYIGDLGVQMEITLETEHIRGSYYYDQNGFPLSISGKFDTAGRKITFIEKDEKGKQTGIFKGIVSESWEGLGWSIEGMWSDGKKGNKIPFKLKKVSNYMFTKLKQGTNVEVATMYPKFFAKSQGIQSVNSKIEEQWKPVMDDFLGESKEAFLNDDSFSGWQLNYNYSIQYYSPELISLAGEVFSYTGGAHGNTNYISSNYAITHGGSELLKLSNLFKPGVPYLKLLSDYCVKDLRKQGAGWIVNGEMKLFKESDLKVFAVSPIGLQFAFAPYAVGPYVEGAYFVTVPFSAMGEIINPGGPLKALLTLPPETDLKD